MDEFDRYIRFKEWNEKPRTINVRGFALFTLYPYPEIVIKFSSVSLLALAAPSAHL